MTQLPRDTAHDWTEPGTFEVAEGVHRIPLPLPTDALRAVNVYAVEDGHELVLIDAGWALQEARHRLEEALASIGHDLRSIRCFLVTHVHRDHYTLGVVLRRLFGARVALGEHERANLVAIREDVDSHAPLRELARLVRYGGAELADRLLANQDWDGIDPSMWEDPDEWLSSGATVTLESRTLEVIHTPGHTRGHVVFLDADGGVLFSGDHVLPHITPSIGFERARPPRPLRDYLASLRLMNTLPDVRLLPAHGPVTGTVHRRTDELLAHHDRRLDQTEATVVNGGARTAYESAHLLTWTRRERAFAQLDTFNQMLAVSETAAHLDVLVDTGRLVSHVHDGVDRYAPHT